MIEKAGSHSGLWNFLIGLLNVYVVRYDEGPESTSVAEDARWPHVEVEESSLKRENSAGTRFDPSVQSLL